MRSLPRPGERGERPQPVGLSSSSSSLPALLSLRERDRVYVGLSTLSQPMYEMGRLAIDKLLRRIAEPSRPVSHTTFSADLIARETCGAVSIPAIS